MADDDWITPFTHTEAQLLGHPHRNDSSGYCLVLPYSFRRLNALQRAGHLTRIRSCHLFTTSGLIQSDTTYWEAEGVYDLQGLLHCDGVEYPCSHFGPSARSVLATGHLPWIPGKQMRIYNRKARCLGRRTIRVVNVLRLRDLRDTPMVLEPYYFGHILPSSEIRQDILLAAWRHFYKLDDADLNDWLVELIFNM